MQKWDVLTVFCDFLPEPHEKHCICICPVEHLFMYINSRPPIFRKAREKAISIENFEAAFLTHQSYVDTTRLEQIPLELVENALNEERCRKGQIAPAVRSRIIDGVAAHEVMEPPHRLLVLG